MRRGFTVLELLVASLLLGMLMTMLTMIFSQSSIAWRTGMAGVADLDDVRTKISCVRYQADNAYVWDGQVKWVHGIFDSQTGQPRFGQRLVDGQTDRGNGQIEIKTSVSAGNPNNSFGFSNSASGRNRSGENYVINVMSFGPDRVEDTRYDNIYTLPDDPNNW